MFSICSFVFCDFGEKFTVYDTNGEPLRECIVSFVSQEEEGVVTVHDDQRHDLEDGDLVTFAEIEGMTELNDAEPMPIKYRGPFTLTIGDTSKFSPYQRGGILKQVKSQKTVCFKSLRASLSEPELLLTDFAKFDRPGQLHIAYEALYAYQKKFGTLPRSWNKEDADKFVEVAKEVNGNSQAKVQELSEKLFRQFAYVARGDLCPMQTVIGSFCAQEVMKACSGKFHPLVQWLYYDALECLPESGEDVPEEACKPTGSRYDGQIAVFGADFQKKLEGLKYFIVSHFPRAWTPMSALHCVKSVSVFVVTLSSGNMGMCVCLHAMIECVMLDGESHC
jgi:ubiquitin-activating enzyme E1